MQWDTVLPMVMATRGVETKMAWYCCAERSWRTQAASASGEEGDDVAARGLDGAVEASPEGEGEGLLLGAGHALVDAHVVVEGFGGVAWGQVVPPLQAHPDVDGFGVLQADVGDALARLPGPAAGLGVEEGNADENDGLRGEAVEEEGGAGDISAEGCDGRDLDYRVEVGADGFLYAGDLICGEGVEQLLADRLWD